MPYPFDDLYEARVYDNIDPKSAKPYVGSLYAYEAGYNQHGDPNELLYVHPLVNSEDAFIAKYVIKEPPEDKNNSRQLSKRAANITCAILGKHEDRDVITTTMTDYATISANQAKWERKSRKSRKRKSR